MSVIEHAPEVAQKKAVQEITKEPGTRNIVQMLIDAGHPLGQTMRDLADQVQIPERSTFLVGLAAFSSAALMTYRVTRHYSDSLLPLGLFVIVEQKPGARKSAIFNGTHKPVRDCYAEINKKRSRELAKQRTKIESIKLGLRNKEPGVTRNQLQNAIENLEALPLPLTVHATDATTAALDLHCLIPNKGAYSLASDEQALLDTLFGLNYGAKGGNKPNIAAILHGFDGGHVSNLRAGREGYSGEIAGSICCFAQAGSIDTILRISNGTGLAERFLIASEPSLLGKRKFTGKICDMTPYQTACRRLIARQGRDGGAECCNYLHFNPEGADMLFAAAEEMEPLLLDGARYSSDLISGLVSKLDTHASKIAALLHLYAHYCQDVIGGEDKPAPSTINPEWLRIAIEITKEQIEAYHAKLMDMALIGRPGEWQTIIDYLDGKGGKSNRVVLENALRKKDLYKGRARLRAVIEDMASHGYLNIKDTMIYLS
ncbi:uncharacterized protein DUF3987 [Buttiauxella sp. BIGb0552]|nr:uncharacterized protein DUF3987 [Buttiauxella sp. BIGb0552]